LLNLAGFRTCFFVFLQINRGRRILNISVHFATAPFFDLPNEPKFDTNERLLLKVSFYKKGIFRNGRMPMERSIVFI